MCFFHWQRSEKMTTTSSHVVEVLVEVLLREESSIKKRSNRLKHAVSPGKVVQASFCSQVENFLADKNVEESGKFEDFGGLQLLNDHVENIRVEWNCNTPRVFANASKRFLFYKHLGMGILNDEEEDDDDKEEDNEEESPACNLMVLPNAELCGLWSVLLFCEL